MTAVQAAKFSNSVKGVLLMLACTLCFSAASAHAADCTSLKVELSRLRSGANSSPQVVKWQDAARKQQKAITAAERDARYFRCGQLAITPKCQALTGKIAEMKANLSAIEKQLARAQRKAPNAAARIRQLEAALARQNCHGSGRTSVATANTGNGTDRAQSGSGFFQLLFGKSKRLEARSGNGGLSELQSRARLNSAKDTPRRVSFPAGGTYRTLCVRTCDGYFFPVSFATGKDQFANDAARCSEMCPAAESELFVYRNPGQSPKNMTSLTGIAYDELENAYRYKTEYVQDCSCRNPSEQKRASRMTLLSGGSDGGFSGETVATAGWRLESADDIRPSLDIPNTEPGSASNNLSRDPLRPDHVSAYVDPDTRFNLEAGFNVRGPITPHQDADGHEAAHAPQEPGERPSLPVLSSKKHPSVEIAVPARPVFSEKQKASPTPVGEAPPKSPIRVVGPEFFVAQ